MTFERPQAWALLVLSIPIVVLHLRFLRRRMAEVPSLILWRSLAPEGLARRGLERLEERLQLGALLAALAAFTAALAGPVTGRGPAPPERLVVVLDVSASMSAARGGRSRFDEARDAAITAMGTLGPGDDVVVWAACEHPFVAVEPTRDVAAARAALLALRPTLERGALAATVARARGAAGPEEEQRVLVLTDASGARDTLKDCIVGVAGATTADNAAIVVAEVEPGDGATDGVLRVRVARTDGRAAPRTAVLSRDGVDVARAEVAVPDEGTAEAVLPLAAFAAGGVARVRLDPPDDFAPDDAVGFVLPAPRRLVVALVAPGMAPSPFLVGALRAMPEHVAADKAVLAGPDAPPRAFAEIDVIVAEGELPLATPRDRPTLLLGAAGRAVERPVVWGTGRHPVLDGVDLAPLRIDRANVLDLAPADRVLIECAEGPLAVASDEGGVRRLRFGFRPGATTLPLEPAFPVLVRNALRWLGRPPLLPPSVRAGGAVATSEPLPAVERTWFVGPGGLAPRPVLVKDGAFAETAPIPPADGGGAAASGASGGAVGARTMTMTVRGLPGEPSTAVNWFAPSGFRLAPEPDAAKTAATSPTTDAAAAVRSLPDRHWTADSRVPRGGICALLGAAILGASALFLGRRLGARAPDVPASARA